MVFAPPSCPVSKCPNNVDFTALGISTSSLRPFRLLPGVLEGAGGKFPMPGIEVSHYRYRQNRTEKCDILLSDGYFYKIEKVNRKLPTFTKSILI